MGGYWGAGQDTKLSNMCHMYFPDLFISVNPHNHPVHQDK